MVLRAQAQQQQELKQLEEFPGRRMAGDDCQRLEMQREVRPGAQQVVALVQ